MPAANAVESARSTLVDELGRVAAAKRDIEAQERRLRAAIAALDSEDQRPARRSAKRPAGGARANAASAQGRRGRKGTRGPQLVKLVQSSPNGLSLTDAQAKLKMSSSQLSTLKGKLIEAGEIRQSKAGGRVTLLPAK